MVRILIIDDDLDILATVGPLLESQGFQISSADTVEKGLEAIPRDSPQLVLLDVLFPEDSHLGFKAARTIRKSFPGLPVFLFSAAHRGYAFGGETAEADEFLVKPVKIDRLVSLIRKHVK
jgi:two-component system OmpR family response regulator